jgi:cytochrome c biogenesis protein CcmG, thiol:disulfide interchange protein DsbE
MVVMKIPMVALAALATLLVGCSSPDPDTTDLGSTDLLTCEWEANAEATLLDGLDLTCLDGGSVSPGIPTPVIINIWASWCEPCREEVPHLRQLAKKYGDRVSILGIDVEEASVGKGRAFAREIGMLWPNLYDKSGSTKRLFGPGVPVTWFVGKNGKVLHRKIGVISSYEELERLALQHGQVAGK